MGEGGINVQSESIAEFETALGRFAQTALDSLQAIGTALSRASEVHGDRRRELRREIARCQDEIANADEEDDTRRVERRLEECEAALVNARRRQRDVDTVAEQYQREARKFEELCTGTTVETRAYLRSLLDQVAAYFAAQNGLGAASPVRTEPRGPRRTNTVGAASGFDPTVFALPAGYHWVDLGEIDTANDLANLRADIDYVKVSYVEIRHGFDALRGELLPMMNEHPDLVSSEVLMQRDRASGVPYEHGLQRVYDAFFGADAIHLSRGRDAEAFTITDGRHRIKVAAEAGWTAVPVKVNDLRNL